MSGTATLRLEDFIQAVQSQLDNAQSAMTMKARNQNLPLTFAIKDINLDLRAHVEFTDSEIRIRPAGPGETDTSLFHLVFTAITRPAIEENAMTLADDDPDDQPLDDIEDLSSDDRKRLEWAGVRTVKQLQRAEERGAVHSIGRVTNLPIDRLKAALTRTSEPLVQRVEPVRAAPDAAPDAPQLIRVTGRNLVRGGQMPNVRIGNRAVSIMKSSANELLLAPGHDQWSGELAVAPEPALATAMSFDLSAFAPARPDPEPEPLVPAMGIAAIPEPTETRQ